jgi:GNAT superfamily N-acetyltransferase
MTPAAQAGAAAGLRVREIAPGETLKPFIDLSWKINARDPHWVPPLRMALETALDRRKHPFHQHADVAYFVAERGGEVVGRTAAVVNHAYNDFHDEKQGTFGLFECVDDAEVAAALLDAAAEWLRARGMERLRGPLNLSTNDEVSSPGVLVEGFDSPPQVLMSHNPPYYAALLESTGLEKAKDVLAFIMSGQSPPARAVAARDRLAGRMGATIRPLNMKDFQGDVDRIKEIYNSAWARNWGFVPMTDAEFAHMAKDLKPIVDPNLCHLAEIDGNPIGFALALPDINQTLKRLKDGRLFPFGFLKFLWYKRKVTAMRVITLGFKPGFQHQGLGPALYLRTYVAGLDKGYTSGEESWILEDNWEMRRALEKMGAQAYKVYRIYERAL